VLSKDLGIPYDFSITNLGIPYLTPRSGIFLQKRRIYNKMNNQNKKIDNEIYYNNTFEFISLATGDGGKSD
jgi:hypothetical protein